MMKHSMILVAVLAAAALVAMVATRQLAVKQGAPQTERAETVQPADIQIDVSVVRERGASSLVVSMAPTDDEVSVSTFALELTVTDRDGGGIATAGKIQADEALTSSSWTFPILSAIPNDSEGLVVKISGVHVATAPYLLTNRQVIATIPVDPSLEPDNLVATLNPEHTTFLQKDTTPIPVDQNVGVR